MSLKATIQDYGPATSSIEINTSEGIKYMPRYLLVSEAVRLTGDPCFVWKHPVAAAIIVIREKTAKQIFPNTDVFLSNGDMVKGIRHALLEYHHAITYLEQADNPMLLSEILELTQKHNQLYSDFIAWAAS